MIATWRAASGRVTSVRPRPATPAVRQCKWLPGLGTQGLARCLTLVGLLAALVAGCSLFDRAAARRSKLLPVSLPDLSRVDQAVQTQARERYAALTATMTNRGTPDAELATAYGQFGLLMQAAEFFEVAEPCYSNAQSLAPDEFRWPYYAAHLRKSRGETVKAEADFKRVLELRPDDPATLIWLGRLYLDKGRAEEAEPLFSKTLALIPNSVAALAGLGRAALAKREYEAAVKHLEQALTIDPEAESLHSPLAMAYRGLGQLDKAEPHAKQWRNRDIFVPDPLMQEMDLVLESGLSYELRGVRALEAKDWKAAAEFFRRGAELTPQNTALKRSLHHKLGTALFMAGDAPGAQKQFEEVVQLAPADGIDESAAKAHYSLAVLLASSGRHQDAIQHFSAAVKYQPSYAEAHLAFADMLRTIGRANASLTEYKETIKINPGVAQARLGYALALIQLHRYQEARDWLTEATTQYPDQRSFALVLARLLAAAPDDRVRDGRRAMAIVEELFKGQKSTELGETMAMTLAEVGEYEKAAAVQRGVMQAAERAGLTSAVRRMAVNLRLYERHQPCRTPWQNDEPARPTLSPRP